MPPGDPSLRRLQTCPLRGRLLSMRSSPNRAFAALIGLALIASACTPRGADSSAPDVEVDPATCSSPTLPEMLTTLSSDPEGRITSLSAGMSGVDLATSEFIFVRAEVAAGETLERILIDTDGDRMSGMWSLQSHLSGSGWNYLVDAAGSVHRHRGPPTKWNFETVGDATVRDDNTFCIPISLLGKKPPSSVGIAVETKEGSLPGRFLRGASFPPGTEELATVPFKTPGRLAFNYSGFPWLIDGCPDKRPTPDALRCAVEVYSKFDQLVIDADFTSSAVPGLERMIKLLAAKKPSLEVWGYVSIVGSTKGEDGIRDRVYSPSDIANLAQRFKALGVSGIFLDEYDVCDPSFETCQPSADGVGIPITRETGRSGGTAPFHGPCGIRQRSLGGRCPRRDRWCAHSTRARCRQPPRGPVPPREPDARIGKSHRRYRWRRIDRPIPPSDRIDRRNRRSSSGSRLRRSKGHSRCADRPRRQPCLVAGRSGGS